FRGYAGTVATGTVRVGDRVSVLPGPRPNTIARIVTADGDLPSASAGQAVTLTLQNEVDVSRGDVIVHETSTMRGHKAMTVRLLWMGEQPLSPGQSFALKLGTAEANAEVVTLRHAVDIHSFQDRPTDALAMNGIGVVDLRLDKAIVATIYSRDRDLGSFILIDRMTNQTVALGTVEPNPPKQANDNVLGARMLRLVGKPGSAQRENLWVAVRRKMIEAAGLFLVVATLAQNLWLALAVTAADFALRPVAHRVAALWGSAGALWQLPSYPGGHAD
ncbi:MAG TPA: hypothetical protein VGM32_12070, partial [Rhodopila sp.]